MKWGARVLRVRSVSRVAFSRSGYPPSAAKGVRVVAVEVEGAQGNLKGPDWGVFTRNVVYREVLAA